MIENIIKDMKIADAWCLGNNGFELYGKETDRLTAVVPSERQLRFLEMKYYNFIHFGINTFYDREWGDGKEKLKKFNPRHLDTDQWCEVLKKTGSKGIIITAKHHDGFCLFDTKHTDHNVMNTPFGRDIVRMLSESCKKYDMKLGIYLSPWDRHESTYGTEEYNDFFVNQLTELCENYGDIFAFWFDGACGEGKNGKKQVYDWERYYDVIRKYQPDAVISVCGPDVRWIGNEGGNVRKSEWSVVPDKTSDNEKTIKDSQQDAAGGAKLAKLNDRDEDLGSRELLKNYQNIIFKPAEADVSINLGWFYHDSLYYAFKKKRTAKYLAEVFFNSVGGNASMLLNVPPDRDGLISSREIETLEEFTRRIKAPFRNPVEDCLFEMLRLDGSKRKIADGFFDFDDDETGIKITLPQEKALAAIYLEEELKLSQRVEEFKVYAKHKDDVRYYEIYSGTVIGSGKIIRFPEYVDAEEIIITPIQSRKNPALKKMLIFSK